MIISFVYVLNFLTIFIFVFYFPTFIFIEYKWKRQLVVMRSSDSLEFNATQNETEKYTVRYCDDGFDHRRIHLCAVFFFIYHSVAHTHRVNQAINKIGFFSIINKLFGFYCPNFGFIYLFLLWRKILVFFGIYF